MSDMMVPIYNLIPFFLGAGLQLGSFQSTVLE